MHCSTYICLQYNNYFAFYPASSKSKPSVKKKRKRIAGKGNEEDNTIKKKKKNQDRPNYFISVPITNPKVIFFPLKIYSFSSQNDIKLINHSLVLITIICFILLARELH